MRYLIVVHAPSYRVGPGVFAAESAFAEHLRQLRRMLPAQIERVDLASPSWSAEYYRANRHHLTVIDEARESIYYTPLNPDTARTRAFWLRHGVRIWRELSGLVRRADVVHSGISTDALRPVCFMALVAAVRQGKRSICIADMDFRDTGRQNYRTGMMSRREYLQYQWVFRPLQSAQLRFAVRSCTMSMLKGRSLVEDFGRGRPNVRMHLDTAHSAEHVVRGAALDRRLAAMSDASRPLRVVYFGRLVRRKGVDVALRVLAAARALGGRAYEFHIIGDGPERDRLRRLSAELGLGDAVRFIDAVPYGPALFDALAPCDLSLATQLSEDTPRSAFDSFAAGMPIAAFDLPYYRTIADSGAVVLSSWLDQEAMARAIVGLDRDRPRLMDMARRGAAYALEHTQERWLQRRIAWTFAGTGIAVPPEPEPLDGSDRARVTAPTGLSRP